MKNDEGGGSNLFETHVFIPRVDDEKVVYFFKENT